MSDVAFDQLCHEILKLRAELAAERERVATLREVLVMAETALSWALIEGLDECVPRTMATEYQCVVSAHEHAKSVLKETKGDGDE